MNKEIYRGFCRTEQGYRIERIIEGDFHRSMSQAHRIIRLSLYVDSYPSQSVATAEIWSDATLKWNIVATIPWPLIKVTYRALPSNDRVTEAFFEDDIKHLLRKTTDILGDLR